MLTCFRCFQGCLWPHLTGARDIEGTKNAKSTSIIDVFIGNILVRGTFV